MTDFTQVLSKFSDDDLYERIIIFIDLLGFESKSKEKGFHKKYENFCSKLSVFFSKEEGIYQTTEGVTTQPKFFIFSDSIIISFRRNANLEAIKTAFSSIKSFDDSLGKHDSGGPGSNSHSAAMHVAVIQRESLLELGLLVRGAITSGEVMYVLDDKKSIMVGDAYNRAVKLEKEVAVYPRVIVCEELYQLWKKEWCLSFGENISGLYHQGSDGYMFVDKWLFWSEEQLFKAYSIIQKALVDKTVRENFGALRAWRWMAINFNNKIEKLSNTRLKKIQFD